MSTRPGLTPEQLKTFVPEQAAVSTPFPGRDATQGQESDPFEASASALRGLVSINTMLVYLTIGEDKGKWGEHVIDGLFEAQRRVAADLECSPEQARRENWNAHALLGHYGPEAMQRAAAQASANGSGG